MSSFKPRISIPDTWAQIGACPICDDRNMVVSRSQGKPDRMTCQSCHVSFEMEIDGPHIRLVTLPQKFAAYIQPAWQTWMTPHEIRAQIKQATHPPQKEPTPESDSAAVRKLNSYIATPTTATPSSSSNVFPMDPLTQEEVTKRATGLAALGNSEREIRETLERFNATREQIDHALSFVKVQKKRNKSNTSSVIIVVLVSLIICLGSAAFVLPMLNIPKYIDIIRPVWNTLQKSFSGSDIYGGITGMEETKPTQMSGSLSPEAKVYFDSVWNTSNNSKWLDKYLLLNKLVPPLELNSFHTSVLEQYKNVVILESEFNQDMATYNSFCITAEQKEITPCNKLNNTPAEISRDLQAQQAYLNQWWSTTACPAYKNYYTVNNVSWPWDNDGCSQP